MVTSFYVTSPKLEAISEHSSLKEAEKDLRAMAPGDYLIVQVVRVAHIEAVPESTRVQLAATRTRAPRDPNAPRKPRKPRSAKPPKSE